MIEQLLEWRESGVISDYIRTRGGRIFSEVKSFSISYCQTVIDLYTTLNTTCSYILALTNLYSRTHYFLSFRI